MARKNRRRHRQHGAEPYSSFQPEILHFNPRSREEDEIWAARVLQYTIHQHIDPKSSAFPMESCAASEVRQLLNLYGYWKTLRLFQHPKGGEHFFSDFILYSLAYISFTRGVEDSSVVSTILFHMHSCHGHFMRLFQRVLQNPIMDIARDQPPHFNPIVFDSQLRVQRLSPFAYFAYHATRERLLFHNTRFIDLRLLHPNGFRPCPLYLSASLGEVELVRFLLQRGAEMGDPFRGMVENRPPWIASLIVKLLSSALRAGALQELPLDDEGSEVESWTLKGGQREIMCTRLLLRAMPHIDIGWLRFRRTSFCRVTFATSEELVRTVSDNGLVPKLKYRCLQPPELKHVSRVAIRAILRYNWQLPGGIFQLQVPVSLMGYLNLEED